MPVGCALCFESLCLCVCLCSYTKRVPFRLDVDGPDRLGRRRRVRSRRCGRRNRKRARRRARPANGPDGAHRRQPERGAGGQIEPQHQRDQTAGPVVVVVVGAAEGVLFRQCVRRRFQSGESHPIFDGD